MGRFVRPTGGAVGWIAALPRGRVASTAGAGTVGFAGIASTAASGCGVGVTRGDSFAGAAGAMVSVGDSFARSGFLVGSTLFTDESPPQETQKPASNTIDRKYHPGFKCHPGFMASLVFAG